MIRLLHTKSALYGYLIEGFRNADERCMRRCEEFGLFLSTTIGAVLKNQKLIQLNEKLKQINREMEKVSILDYLTELYNRRGFYDELYKLVHSEDNKGKYLTFFSVDMDGLKIINDSYGHNEGDFALKTLAVAIRNFAVRNGICARYGGDEFVCAIITEQATSFTADVVRQRFQATFDKSRELAEKPFTISASIGCRCALIDKTLNLEELMRLADEDMYIDKQSRRKERK
jgi:diguanylate cyclase (GGDEF)-like protein